jgi:hypothetical protein
VSGRQQAFGVYAYESVSATFTITSGTTTITGNIVASNKLAPVGYYCPTFTIKPSISYTATINGQTYSGTGVTSGSFDTSPAGQASMTASFTDTGSTGGGGTGGGGTGGGGTAPSTIRVRRLPTGLTTARRATPCRQSPNPYRARTRRLRMWTPG